LAYLQRGLSIVVLMSSAVAAAGVSLLLSCTVADDVVVASAFFSGFFCPHASSFFQPRVLLFVSTLYRRLT
jgi:hypothetical protein